MDPRWWISVLLVIICNQNNQEGIKGVKALSSNMTKTSGNKTERPLLHGGTMTPESSFINSSLANDGGIHKYAVINVGHTKADIHGISATINVWRPNVETRDLTIAQVWIVNNEGGARETIEAGWMIDPTNQPQANPFLFIFSTADGYRTRCYNLECGFEWQDRSIRPGSHQINPWSVEHGRRQHDIRIRILRDFRTGDWWFYYDDKLVGKWPGRRFPNLRRGANLVQWGGEVVANPKLSNRPTTTGMGSGRFAEDGYGRAAYMSNVYYYDAYHVAKLPDYIVPQTTDPKCYTLTELGTDAVFYFGGPGGREQACIDAEVQPPPP